MIAGHGDDGDSVGSEESTDHEDEELPYIPGMVPMGGLAALADLHP